jgi:hypothetical protein
MSAIATMLFLLTIFPLVVVLAFHGAQIDRKEHGMIEELKMLKAMGSHSVAAKEGELGFKKAIARRYNLGSMLPPALLLLIFNAMGFLCCYLFLILNYFDGGRLLNYRPLIDAAVLPLATFIGVYVCNFGVIVRRMYVTDLTEHVFWSSINRLVLSLGFAIVISEMFISKSGSEFQSRYAYLIFFSVGFVSNVFLDWALELSLRAMNIRKPKVEDLSLRLIQGVTIWSANRLEEEGIENVQNLATADVYDLAIRTHFNIRTLADWIDQAILLDRLGMKALELADKAFIRGAIDMAWSSPDNDNGDKTTANSIASALNLNPRFVTDLMNNLREDASVAILWDLWQQD